MECSLGSRKRMAIAQILRLSGMPDDNWLTQPAPERDKA
jgi:hypothetical protein